MSTNLDPLNSEEYPPDPESLDYFSVDPVDDIPPSAIVPVFDDQVFDASSVATYDEYGNILEYETAVAVEQKPIGRTWVFDFNTGEFLMSQGGTPRKIQNDDVAILQQWIRRALTTERLAYNIYPQGFGVELEPILSNALTGPAATAHVVTTVTEALLYHDRISNVTNVVVTDENGTIFIKADVKIEEGELFSVNVPLGEV